MDRTLREDADAIIASSLKAVLPDEAVRRALAQFRPGGAECCWWQRARLPGR